MGRLTNDYILNKETVDGKNGQNRYPYLEVVSNSIRQQGFLAKQIQNVIRNFFKHFFGSQFGTPNNLVP